MKIESSRDSRWSWESVEWFCWLLKKKFLSLQLTTSPFFILISGYGSWGKVIFHFKKVRKTCPLVNHHLSATLKIPVG